MELAVQELVGGEKGSLLLLDFIETLKFTLLRFGKFCCVFFWISLCRRIWGWQLLLSFGFGIGEMGVMEFNGRGEKDTMVF